MDEQTTDATGGRRRRRWLGPASLLAVGLVAGGILAGSQTGPGAPPSSN